MKPRNNKNEISDISKRFLLAIDMVGYTGYRLAREVKVVSQSILTHIRLGRNDPSTKILTAFLEKFPIINARWLLTGQGEPKNEIQIDYEIEPQNFIKILHEIPVEDIIHYIQDFEAARGFENSHVYKMFLELRMQRKLIKKMELLEAKYSELLKIQAGEDSDGE